MTTTLDKIGGEISVDIIENVIKAIPNQVAINKSTHSILLHGMGGKPRTFYRKLSCNANVQVLWTGLTSTIWWTYLLSFIPGQAGLVKVLNRKMIANLYLSMGELSMCGLYFVPNHKVESIMQDVKKTRGRNIEKLLLDETDYFLLSIDFDYHGGDRDGEVYYGELIIGDNLDGDLKNALTNDN